MNHRYCKSGWQWDGGFQLKDWQRLKGFLRLVLARVLGNKEASAFWGEWTSALLVIINDHSFYSNSLFTHLYKRVKCVDHCNINSNGKWTSGMESPVVGQDVGILHYRWKEWGNFSLLTRKRHTCDVKGEREIWKWQETLKFFSARKSVLVQWHGNSPVTTVTDDKLLLFCETSDFSSHQSMLFWDVPEAMYVPRGHICCSDTLKGGAQVESSIHKDERLGGAAFLSSFNRHCWAGWCGSGWSLTSFMSIGNYWMGCSGHSNRSNSLVLLWWFS